MKPVAWMIDKVKESGAAQCGALSFDVLRPLMSERAQKRAALLCPGLAGVLVGAFPYFSGHTAGNVSLYARGLDYHLGVTNRLQAACRQMKEQMPGHAFVPAVDASPLPERAAALLSGIGKLGRNGLVLCDPYGSYVFLGAILTSYPIRETGRPVVHCKGCGACVRACPSGALSLKEGQVHFDKTRCLSHITQIKQTPMEEEISRLEAHPYVWGCDLCQLACPENRKAEPSPLADLTGAEQAAPYLSCLTPDMLEGLDETAFQKKFGNRAFAWRGLQILKRNFDIQLHKRPKKEGY